MEVILFELALTFYFAATIVCVMELFKGTKTTSRIMLSLVVAGFALHTANIIARYVISGHIPIANLHEASSFFSWCIVLLFFYLEYRYKLGLLGAFIMPVVFILMLSSSMLPRTIEPLSPVLQSYWLGIHTMLAFLGDAAFAMAFGIGLVSDPGTLCQIKHLGGLFRKLPSLQILMK
jgi:ABC-type transport system involved in cytochrome c biogenesis permease subunit